VGGGGWEEGRGGIGNGGVRGGVSDEGGRGW